MDVLGSAIAQTLWLPSPAPLALAGGPSVCWHVCFSLMHSSSFGELNAKPSFNAGIFKASLKGRFLPCQPCHSLSSCDPRTWVLDSCSEHQGFLPCWWTASQREVNHIASVLESAKCMKSNSIFFLKPFDLGMMWVVKQLKQTTMTITLVLIYPSIFLAQQE